MEDRSTLARILAEGDSDHATEGHRLFCDGAVVDGRWQVLALLGKGGNGEVYRVCDIKAGTIGALKVPCAEENNLRRRFDRELEILQQIATWPLSEASRHFPRIIDRGMVAEKGVPYFVIEFLQPLKVPKKSPTVRKLILEVCEAVRQLHKNRYLHRDIKLANLMQRENGDVVLIDFGLVGRIEDFENPLADRVSMTQGGRVAGVGTEGSTAPEQLYGHASVRSDIYAIASVAVDCFGGELPRKWIPIIQKAHNPKEEHRFDGIDDFVSAVKRDVPEREWRSGARPLAIALSIVGVCSMLACFYVQRKTSNGNNPKQGQETWEEFVSRRVQEDRPETEESLKELRAHMAEVKRETEDRNHEIETSIIRSEVIAGVTWNYQIFYCSGHPCARIFSAEKCSGNVVVPTTLGGHAVKEIGDRAFSDCHALTSVIIPTGVTRIGCAAFDNCGEIKSIVIPQGVTCIDAGAFSDCASLAGLALPSTVVQIGRHAFEGCEKLTTMVIPSGVTNIGDSVFANCKRLESVTLPANVREISDSMFRDCAQLAKVTIPQCVTNIGESAFRCCGALKSIMIPLGVTRIGDSAFCECKGLASVVMPDGLTSIGNWAFSGCLAIPKVELPSGVTQIGKYAFQSCGGLASVSLPLGVKSISDSMFANCSGLEEITIPQSITNIGAHAFSNCDGLRSVSVPSSVKSIGDWSFYRCDNLASVTMAEGVSGIGDGAFRDCKRIKSIRLPASVKHVGKNAFDEHCAISKAGAVRR